MPACPVLTSFNKNLNQPLDIDLSESLVPRKTQKDRAIYLADWAVRGWAADLAKQVGLDDLACDLSCLGDFYDLDTAKLEAIKRDLEYKRTPKYYDCINAVHMASQAYSLAKVPMVARDWETLGTLCADVFNLRAKTCSEPLISLDTVLDCAIKLDQTPLR